MKNNLNKSLYLLFTGFILFINLGFSQNKTIKIRYIGNCGLHITDGENHVYTDFPYKSGAHHYAEYPQSELDSLKENAHYIFTHKHSDHYYKGKAKKIIKSKKGIKYNKKTISKLEEAIPNFKIQVFKTKHLFSFAHYSYLIEWHGQRIFLSGDTESAETILKIEDMDVAFIPAWLVREIIASEEKFKTKKIVIYHIGPRDDVNVKGDRVLMLKQRGQEIILN
ncbi:MAG: MBL fold metallo-hydrolase [Flavobacteriales bacterium]